MENIHELLSTVVKEEPLDDEPEISTFCYETVTKEEVILEEDQVEHADDLPESVSKPPTANSNEHLFKCPVCNRMFDRLFKRNRCVKRHDAIKTERFKCKICGKCFGTNYDHVRHEATHISSDAVVKGKIIEEDLSVEAAMPHDIDMVKEEPPEASDSSFDPASVVTYEAAFMKFTNECSLFNKQSIKRHGSVPQQDNASKSQTSKHVVVPEQAADYSNAEKSQLDENSSYFRYETVTKEELIIEDDKLCESAEDEQEDFRFWLEEDESTVDAVKSQQKDESVDTPDNSEQNQTVKCKMCNMTFNSEHVLQMHYKTHNPVVMRSILSEEFLVHNQAAQNYTCSFCEVTYPSRNQALTHLQRHIIVIDGVYQCKKCGLRLGSNSAYQKHLKTHNEWTDRVAHLREKQGGYINYVSTSKDPCEKSNLHLHCKTCDVFFNNTVNLNIHLWESKLRIVRSKIDAAVAKEQPVVNDRPLDPVRKPKTAKIQEVAVGQKFKKLVDPVQKRKTAQVKKDDVIHSEIQRDEMGFFNCSKCAYKTNKETLLRGHIRRHQAVELGLFPCDVCQRRCIDKRHLAVHKEIHNKGGFVQCRTCNESFATRAALNRHQIVHSKNETSRQFLEKVTEDERGFFTCSVCGKSNMKIRKYAFEHFRLHVLGKATRNSRSRRESLRAEAPTEWFERHIETREEAKEGDNDVPEPSQDDSYECEICQKNCRNSSTLKRHMKSHEALRFNCQTCKERFATRTVLMRHREKKHKRNDVYQCSRCDEKFPTQQKVLEHFRVHRLTKPKSTGRTRAERAKARQSTLNSEEKAK